jgi:hypothetical protein
MKTLVFFLEEQSARVMLEEFIRANFEIDDGKISLRFIVHEGKRDND